MTIEEAIKFAEYAQIMADGKPDVQEFYKLAEAALRAQQELESKLRVLESSDMFDEDGGEILNGETMTDRHQLNEPLTLDELRMMSGDPVFVVTDRLKEWCIVHSHHSDDVIGGGIIMTRRTAEKRTYQYDCYGKTWLAYRNKPEEETV